MKKPDTLENQVKYVYLALGSNLGKKIKNLELAKYKLSKIGVNIIKTSSFYCTKSWPNTKFPDFINLVLIAKTKLLLPDLFKQIKLIEKSIGRSKAPKNYPRICDIDIIDYNGEIIHRKLGNYKLNTPHKRMHNRNFVLFPLYELDKDWVHPKLNKNIVILMSNLTSNQLLGIKIAQ